MMAFVESPNKGLWIRKPHAMNRGRGIAMIANVQDIRDENILKELIKERTFW